MSDTMEEGVIASWLKKVGDKVASGDILAEVETDKATMELESYDEGVLLHIGVKESEAAKVDSVIAIIGEEGENIDDLLADVEKGGGDNSNKQSENNGKEKSENKKEKVEDKAESDKDDNEKEQEDADIDTSDIKATVVTMPKMSDTMQEGVIAGWLKKEGDEVSSGDILAEVETDKATMELESYEDGTLLYIGPKEGDSVPVDAVIAIIGEKGADYKKLLKAQEAKPQKKDSSKTEKSSTEEKSGKAEVEAAPDPAPTHSPASDHGSSNGRLLASPLAKKLAEDKGYDIGKIKGSGDGGRIVKRDVENYKPSAEPAKEAAPAKAEKQQAPSFTLPAVVGEESYEEVKVSQMRKTIARRLAESKFTSPHFYLTMEINMDKAVAARQGLNELSPIKISFNDLVIKAAAAALRQHQEVNVSWQGDVIRKNKHVHIGVAVAVDEGLLVPVIRFADNKSLSHIAAEVKELAGKAKNKQLQPKDWEGSTFTISNLGMFGIEEFTAIINPPDACILAVGGIKETPIVKNGQIVPGNIMKVTLSCDHRVVDGAMGAAFLKTLKMLLEDPIRILI